MQQVKLLPLPGMEKSQGSMEVSQGSQTLFYGYMPLDGREKELCSVHLVLYKYREKAGKYPEMHL